MISSGTILGGRYEIIEKIGSGGMSIVYKAKCKKLERYVAVKVLRDEFVNDESFVIKFRVEAQAAASLSHPNIVNIYDVGNDKEVYYIVMEYIEGMTLKDYIHKRGRLDSEETLRIAKDIGEALKVAHSKNIIHRDIKPQNIMVTKTGGVKVTDFGIARATSSSTITSTSNAVGSVHYFSPEQARGGYVDEKSDLYSLGITMYEMVTGTLPFQAQSPVSVALQHIKQDIPKPSSVNANIWPVLESIIIKATQKKPELRYQTAEQLVYDMDRALQNPSDNFIKFTDFNDSPTINMSKADMAIIKKQINDENQKKPINRTKPRKKSNNKSMIIGSIVTSIVIISVLAFFGVKLLTSVNAGPKLIEVPSVINKNFNDAKTILSKLNLVIKKVDEQYDDNVDKGKVISQQPLEDEKVEEGTLIEVKISKGIEKLKVPGVVGKTYNEAKELLAENFKTEVKTQYNEDVELGNVIRQSPEALTEATKNQTIILIVSKGPEDKNVIVPAVFELKEEQARDKLTDNDLTIGEVTYSVHDKIKKGYVVSQNIEPGKEVKKDSVVSLVVSLGPEDDSVTDAISSDESDINKQDQDNNKLVTKNINISDILENGKDKQHMVVIIEDDKKRESIFDQEVTHKSFPINKIIEGSGIKKLKIYLDGNLKVENEIDFDKE